MKKYFLALILTFCLFMSACTSINASDGTDQTKTLYVKQMKVIKNWDVKVTPRLDHKRWVYDTSITYLGDENVQHLTVIYYDKTKVDYEEVKPQTPLESFGSSDYENSVYSRRNNHLSFTLKWSEDNNKVYTGVTNFNVKSK
ncbi:hypothetical protein CN514_06085 [Bacillus sp. AFS001701]|uniref:hypothetical protein n=1 Tax=Bacillaceae TaxID=186817 RepID=UPI000BF2C353|nr:hypothetical protein [Bacillus sp. AFS001701]PET71746.1 hypothetical protein CN514_06085 [Bacillus sp. AFS001701]